VSWPEPGSARREAEPVPQGHNEEGGGLGGNPWVRPKEKTAEGAAVFEGMKLGEVGSPDIGALCQRRSHSFEGIARAELEGVAFFLERVGFVVVAVALPEARLVGG
jgi:hypothetical protein